MPLAAGSKRIVSAMRRAAPWFRTRVGEKAGLRHVPEDPL